MRQGRDADPLGDALQGLGPQDLRMLITDYLCMLMKSTERYGDLYGLTDLLLTRTRCPDEVPVGALALMNRVHRETKKGLTDNNVKNYWFAAFRASHDYLMDESFTPDSWEVITCGAYPTDHAAYLHINLMRVLQWDCSISFEMIAHVVRGLRSIRRHKEGCAQPRLKESTFSATLSQLQTDHAGLTPNNSMAQENLVYQPLR